ELCLAAVIEGDDEIIEPADFIGTEMWMGFIHHIQLAGVDKTILTNIVICAKLLPELQLEQSSDRLWRFFILEHPFHLFNDAVGRKIFHPGHRVQRETFRLLIHQKVNRVSKRTARRIRVGSSMKLKLCSTLIVLLRRSACPLKGSTRSPKISGFRQSAIELMVKSLRYKSSFSVDSSTSGSEAGRS